LVIAGRGRPDSRSLFLASPRKSKQKEGDHRLAPFGSTRLCITKNGKWAKTRCAQTTPISDPFSVTHKRLRLQWIKVKINCNQANLYPRFGACKYQTLILS
jgi:hypothetical protein